VLKRLFRLEEAQTTIGSEVIGGITTFVTMSYIIVVNPAILKAAGIPAEPSMVATIVTAIFGTLIMGLYANRPFAIAPYMGENAFIAYTVVQVLGYSWQSALAAIFLAGILQRRAAAQIRITTLPNATPDFESRFTRHPLQNQT